MLSNGDPMDWMWESFNVPSQTYFVNNYSHTTGLQLYYPSNMNFTLFDEFYYNAFELIKRNTEYVSISLLDL